MVNYNKAKRYAIKCGYGLDLVHDAYLAWHKKTGNNLFLEPEHRVMAVMGWTVRKNRNVGAQMWRGIKYKRWHIPFPEHVDTHNGAEGGHMTNEYLVPVEPNQIDYCSYNEILPRFESLDGFTRKIFIYLTNGYKAYEIAKLEKASIQLIHHYIKKIRYIGGANTHYKDWDGTYKTIR